MENLLNRLHSPEDSVVATYYIETKGDLAQVARELVVLETTAPWVAATQPTDLYLQAVGEVLEVKPTGPGRGYISLLYPLINMDLEESAFPCLWLSMIGGPTFALASYEKSRLVDFAIPQVMMDKFPGPAFGIDGTRQLLNLTNDELMVGTIVKPTAGLTPEEVADFAYQAALGGICFIKDDEKMMNTTYCPLGLRVKLVSAALRRAEAETGLKVLYAAHITTTPDRIIGRALEALENGATALMVNFFAAGFSSLQLLRQHPDINVPIYAHCGGREALGRATGQGISPSAVVKMVRLLGGDYFRAGMHASYLVDTDEDIETMHEAATGTWCSLKPILPAVSGGLNPKTIGVNVSRLGRDNLFLAGTGILSNPAGPKAGVQALVEAAAGIESVAI
ncbi:MAG: RuBisCO large subunit C-terminal-like domain-containing protein [Chitinophagaceae bacterium]